MKIIALIMILSIINFTSLAYSDRKFESTVDSWFLGNITGAMTIYILFEYFSSTVTP